MAECMTKMQKYTEAENFLEDLLTKIENNDL